MSTDPITNSEDFIHSDDIIERYNHLTDAINDVVNDARDFDKFDVEKCIADNKNSRVKDILERLGFDMDEFDEWLLLKDTFIDNVDLDLSDGVCFYNEYYMDEDWAKDECENLEYITKDIPYLISSNIDWDDVANDLKSDYSSVDFDGVTYMYLG